MVFPIAGGTQDTGYEISNSIRFDDAGGSYIQRTAGTNTGEDNATLSFWFKLSNIKSANNGGTIMGQGNTSGYHVMQIYAQKIYIGSANFGIMFPNLIRDPSAWYHLFVAFDTSQSTNTNRVKAYLNGVLLTGATGFTDYPDQNENLGLCVNGTTTRIGGRGNSGDESFDGYLTEFHFLDGTTKAYTDFGEFNDNGVWIPKKYTGGSYGDNGFFLEFKQTGGSADASGLGADTSGEGHHFSGNNIVAATDITTDTPTNNFCTWNPLIGRSASYAIFAEGNLDADFTSDGIYQRATGSIGVTSGKWYAEIKCIDDGGATDLKIGVEHASPDQSTLTSPHRVVVASNGNKQSDGSASSFGDSYSDGDIVGVYLDMDNGTIKFSKNGTAMASGASAFTDLISAMPESGWAFFAFGYDNANVQANFGNSPFSISSGNADANGYGNFEYSPTLSSVNYYALCTKNLAEFG